MGSALEEDEEVEAEGDEPVAGGGEAGLEAGETAAEGSAPVERHRKAEEGRREEVRSC